MTATPRLSVVMTVFNGERHLREAMDSMLAQTMADFELLVVDDTSGDATPQILADYATRDSRVRVIRNESNLGPYPSANRALEQARAPIVARMDADDVALPERFAKQVAFLDAHPDHLLVGCSYASIDEAGRQRFIRSNPMDWRVAGWTVRLRMPMVHPGFCYRRLLPDGTPVRYAEDFRFAQDFRLAGKLAQAGRIAVLEEVLVHYRMHPDNISSSKLAEQDLAARNIAWEQVSTHYPEALHKRLGGFIDVLYRQRDPDAALLAEAISGMRAAIAFDGVGLWAKRRAAGMIAEAFLRSGGMQAARLGIAFARLAPDLLGPLAVRFLELKGWKAQRPAP
ncbi:glycosyltransferase family 2 protein [Tsuneonella mangrovi]|uniref:glycosyltransferase family 2 protein n=1 Tax=Tsuneonella mangrovi TaxID=1982042 RepID=UPI000BA1E099|nr:glycosyltransferase family 2 protein [Tsuneonella mangrovi]